MRKEQAGKLLESILAVSMRWIKTVSMAMVEIVAIVVKGLLETLFLSPEIAFVVLLVFLVWVSLL